MLDLDLKENVKTEDLTKISDKELREMEIGLFLHNNHPIQTERILRKLTPNNSLLLSDGILPSTYTADDFLQLNFNFQNKGLNYLTSAQVGDNLFLGFFQKISNSELTTEELFFTIEETEDFDLVPHIINDVKDVKSKLYEEYNLDKTQDALNNKVDNYLQEYIINNYREKILQGEVTL